MREREHALHRTDEEEEGEEEGGAAATNDDDIDALIIIEIVSVVFLNGAWQFEQMSFRFFPITISEDYWVLFYCSFKMLSGEAPRALREAVLVQLS